MTLLTTKDLEQTTASLLDLEQRCRENVGLSPYEIGCRAFGLDPADESERQALSVACIPITAGNGILGDFCDIVARIIEQLAGARAFVTQGTDVTGVEEAVWAGADIVFMADDDTFVAFNMRTRVLSDNSIATGRIFAAVLDCAKPDDDEPVLVLGAGKVGLGATCYLTERGIATKWFDSRIESPQGFDPACRCSDWSTCSWSYIVDATTAPEIVDAAHIGQDGIVSAPGVPFGVTPEAVDRARFVFHDNLAMGVVAMFCQVCGSNDQAGHCPTDEGRANG